LTTFSVMGDCGRSSGHSTLLNESTCQVSTF